MVANQHSAFGFPNNGHAANWFHPHDHVYTPMV